MNPQDTPPIIEKPAAVPAKPVVISHPGGGRKKMELLFRVATIGLLILSIVVAWWSFTQVLAPRQKAARELGLKLSKLSAEVDEMERQAATTDPAELAAKFRQVDAALFSGPASLESWWSGVREASLPLGLDVKVDFGKVSTRPTSQDKISVIPVTLVVDVMPLGSGSFDSAYHRILKLTDQLVTSQRRCDLNRVTIVGGTNSITQAVLSVDLWAAEGGIK